jgi:threonine synthase
LKRALSEGVVPKSARALAVVTGSGLKDVRAAQQAVKEPFEVRPDGSGLEEILARQGLIPATKTAATS